MPGPAAIDLGGQVIPQPTTALVVKWKPGPDGNNHWIDAYGTIFDPFVRVSLPDEDVFSIDATANPAGGGPGVLAHVGTTALQHGGQPEERKASTSRTPTLTMTCGSRATRRASRPVTGNACRQPHLGHRPRGEDHHRQQPQRAPRSHEGDGQSRPQRGSPGGARRLERRQEPLRCGAGLRASSPSTTRRRSRPARPRRARPARSPSAAAAPRASRSTSTLGLAFVLTRSFDDGISVVDVGSRKEVGHLRMFNPEPASVTAGRCSTSTTRPSPRRSATRPARSCHIGGDFDGLAWDLGNPEEHPCSPSPTLAPSECRHPHHPRGGHRGPHRGLSRRPATSSATTSPARAR